MLDLDVTNSIGSGAEGLPAELNEDPDYVVSDRPKRDRKPVTLYKADAVNESKSSSTIIEVNRNFLSILNIVYILKL